MKSQKMYKQYQIDVRGISDGNRIKKVTTQIKSKPIADHYGISASMYIEKFKWMLDKTVAAHAEYLSA